MDGSGKADSSIEFAPTVNDPSSDRLSQGGLKSLPKDPDSTSCNSGSDAPLPSDLLSSLGEDSGKIGTLLYLLDLWHQSTSNDLRPFRNYAAPPCCKSASPGKE